MINQRINFLDVTPKLATVKECITISKIILKIAEGKCYF